MDKNVKKQNENDEQKTEYFNFNSTKNGNCEQMLLDIITAITKSKNEKIDKINLLKLVNDLHDQLPDDVKKDAAKIFDQRQHSYTSYIQTPTLKECSNLSILFKLKPNEMRILMVIERIALRQRIMISQSQLQEITDLSENSIRAGINALLKYNIMYVEKKATARSAPIYRLNSAVFRDADTKTKTNDVDDLQIKHDVPYKEKFEKIYKNYNDEKQKINENNCFSPKEKKTFLKQITKNFENNVSILMNEYNELFSKKYKISDNSYLDDDGRKIKYAYIEIRESYE